MPLPFLRLENVIVSLVLKARRLKAVTELRTKELDAITLVGVMPQPIQTKCR